MYKRTIKGRKEYIFKNTDEFRKFFPDEKLERNWREADVGSYTLTDD